MRVVVHLDSNDVEFVELGVDGPYPYLIEVGDLQIAARAGSPQANEIGATESSSVTIRFRNCENKASAVLGWPLRALADIYDDDDALFFTGILSSFQYANDEGTAEIGA